MVYIQGHPVFHLACGLMYFLIEKSNNPLTCFQYDATTMTFSTYPEMTELNDNFDQLTIIHFLCFFLLTVVNFMDSNSLGAHQTVILSMMTVPLYQYSILRSQQILSKTNIQINTGCYSNQMGGVKFWITTEVTLFYINLMILAVQLIKSRLTSRKQASDEVEKNNLEILKKLAPVYNEKAFKEEDGQSQRANDGKEKKQKGKSSGNK
jgi:hypothetical protein